MLEVNEVLKVFQKYGFSIEKEKITGHIKYKFNYNDCEYIAGMLIKVENEKTSIKTLYFYTEIVTNEYEMYTLGDNPKLAYTIEDMTSIIERFIDDYDRKKKDILRKKINGICKEEE